MRDKGGKGQHCRSIDRASVSVIDIGGMLVFATLVAYLASDIATAYQFDLKGSCSCIGFYSLHTSISTVIIG